MQFAAPGLLALLPLAAVPILVHLLYKRRRATIDLPSLRLLRNVELRLSPRRKLREMLLLAARCLFVMMIVFAVARPISRGSTGSSTTPVDHVFVIDNTASMHLTGGGGASAFEIARRRVGEALDELGPKDRAALLPLVEPDGWPAFSLTNDRAALRKALEQLVCSDAGADVAQALTAALDLAHGGSAPRREVVFFSDFRGPAGRSDLATRRVVRSRSPRTGVLLVDCATLEGKANVSLELLFVDPPAPLVGRPVEITIRLTNSQPEELVRGVSLELGGVALETRSITVPGGGTAETRLRVARADQVGWTHGRVTLASDGFMRDNRAGFVLRVRERLSVVVIDPAMNDTVPDPEATGRFLTRLLDPSGDGTSSGIAATRLRPADARSSFPTQAHAVFVCGYRTVSDVGASSLELYARNGGFVGVVPEATDTAAGASLHWLAAWPTGPALELDPPGRVFPADVSEDSAAEPWRDITVKRHLPLRARKDAFSELTFLGREPALVTCRVGEGHTLGSAFGLAPSWGSFTFHPQVVALLHRLTARYAAPPRLVVGTAGARLRVPTEGAGPAQVAFDGEPLGEIVPEGSGEDSAYDLGRVLRAGVFAFEAEGGLDFQRYLAVNPDPTESLLARPPDDVVSETYDDARLVGPDDDLQFILAERRAGSEFSAAFLLLALVFALAEAVLGNRFTKAGAAALRPRGRGARKEVETIGESALERARGHTKVAARRGGGRS